MIFEIFRYNSLNFPKISELFLEIILLKFSEILIESVRSISQNLEIFLENFEMVFKIFRCNSQNFPKYFLKCYEIILKILRNNYRNFSE